MTNPRDDDPITTAKQNAKANGGSGWKNNLHVTAAAVPPQSIPVEQNGKEASRAAKSLSDDR